MKKLLLGLCLMAITFSGTLFAEPMVLKYAQFEPPQAFAMKKIWYPWIEKMNKAGEGIYRIDVFPGGTLNRVPPKQLKILRDGVAEIAFLIQNYTPGDFPDDGVVEIPFLTDNDAITSSVAILRMYQKGLLTNYDSVVPLLVSTGQQYAIHSTIPVKVPEDLRGKKIRATGEIQLLIARELGAAPVGMPATKIAESMSRNLIQATTNEWNGMRTFKISDVAKYHCMVPMGTITFMTAMNKAAFNKLPKMAQTTLMNYQEYTTRLWANEMDKSLNEHHKLMMADPDHHVYYPTESELAQWKAVTDRAVEKWLQKDPRRAKLLKIYKQELELAKM